MMLLRTDLKHPRVAALSWLLASFFVVFQFFLQSATSVLSQYWQADFHISAVGLSILSSAFFYTYVLMQVPVGVLFDHYQPEKLIAKAAATVGLGCLVLAFTHWFWLGFLARLAIGAGCAFGFVGMLKITSLIFQPKRFAFMVGVSESFTMTGVTLGVVLLAWVLTFSSWRIDMMVCGLMALTGSTVAFIIVRLQRGDLSAPKQHPFAWGHVWKKLILTAKNKQIWLGSLYGFFIFAMVNVFTSLWGVDFLEHTQALNRQSAANVMSMIFIGIAIGGPILGLLTHRWVSHRQAMSCCALLSTILMSYLLWMPVLPLWVLYTGYTVMGMFCAAYIPCFTVIKDNAPSAIQATSLAFANMTIMAGAPVLQTLIGIILQHMGGAVHASAFSYRMALLVLPAGMLIAWILCYFIQDARPHATEAAQLP